MGEAIEILLKCIDIGANLYDLIMLIIQLVTHPIETLKQIFIALSILLCIGVTSIMFKKMFGEDVSKVIGFIVQFIVNLVLVLVIVGALVLIIVSIPVYYSISYTTFFSYTLGALLAIFIFIKFVSLCTKAYRIRENSLHGNRYLKYDDNAATSANKDDSNHIALPPSKDFTYTNQS